MNRSLTALGISIIGSLALASCELPGGDSGGTHLINPTVEQMADMERKWGVETGTPRSRHLYEDGVEAPGLAPGLDPQRNLAPAPAVPLPQTQPVVPPVFEPQPGVTPDQIQKLKN